MLSDELQKVSLLRRSARWWLVLAFEPAAGFGSSSRLKALVGDVLKDQQQETLIAQRSRVNDRATQSFP